MVLKAGKDRGQIGPSLRGLIYQYERYGQVVTSKWPKKRGKPRSEKQALAQYAFSEVCKAIKGTAAEIQMYHRENASGTPMLPRDTLMAALYGNGPTINLYGGKVIKPMANKYLASTVLDAIGWEYGALLFRGAETWDALPPGEPGQVLIQGNLGEPPFWGDAPGGGGMPKIYAPPFVANENGSSTSRVTWFQPAGVQTIKSISFVERLQAGQTCRVSIFLTDGNGVSYAMPVQEVLPFVGDGSHHFRTFELPAPLVLDEDCGVAVFLTVVQGTSTTAMACRRAQDGNAPVPMLWGFGAYTSTVKNPAVGSTFLPGTWGSTFIWVEFV